MSAAHAQQSTLQTVLTDNSPHCHATSWLMQCTKCLAAVQVAHQVNSNLALETSLLGGLCLKREAAS